MYLSFIDRDMYMWFHGSGMGYAPTQVADTEPPPDLVMNEDANLIPGQSKQKNQDNAMGHRSEIKEGQNDSEEEEDLEDEDDAAVAAPKKASASGAADARCDLLVPKL